MPKASTIRRVLIVDDNPQDREMVRLALRSDRTQRYELVEMDNGEKGLRTFREAETPFELIILDWRLPDMNGVEFVEQLQGEHRIPPVPVVLLTSSEISPHALDPLQHGIQEFFLKSMVTPELLPHVANNAMERHRLLERTIASEIEAEESRNRADAANRAKSHFLATMSHELRNPLTAILGMTELLQENPTNDDRQQMLAMIAENGRHLHELLNDILDLAKIEAGGITIDLAESNVAEIAASLCNLLRYRAADEGLSLRLEVKSPPPRMMTDPIRIRQILLNLIGNAIKFNNQGEILVTVDYQTNDSEKQAIFEVIDTGIGIPPDRLTTIFEPFVQVAEDIRRQQQGVGLGLPISREIATLLGGELSVESEFGVGSRFRLTLPVVEASEASSPPPKPTYLPVEEADWQSLRILVAEDTPANQFLLRRMLERTEAKLFFVSNGEDAIQEILLAQESGDDYQLILMDMQMPVMDGYTAVRKLREMGHSTPIVAITASAMAGDRQRCEAAGCNEYVSKPFDRSELLSKVGAMLFPSHLPRTK
ncbi:response regulator [Blastopirellula sp. J2-11]|uniref:ATP-binding response regulator n=1 Tax=Blastopirellula sp. J2-11 TaxID=2943192 RepID=UPI0021C630CA|nr:hybrid sensor histidine kinase/response regulator [Blastopirellula sp. J2-11]UUO05050.1 response regulator [Blastopirellula sp. J2-11]